MGKGASQVSHYFIVIYFVPVYCKQLKNILVNLFYVTYFIENNNMINIIVFISFMIKHDLFISAIKMNIAGWC